VSLTRQPLIRLLETEGLPLTIEEGSRKVALEFGRGEDEFAAAGISTLEEWVVWPSRCDRCDFEIRRMRRSRRYWRRFLHLKCGGHFQSVGPQAS